MLNNFLTKIQEEKPESVQLVWTVTSEKMMVTISYANRMYQTTEDVMSEYLAAATFLDKHFRVNRSWKDIDASQIRDFVEYTVRK